MRCALRLWFFCFPPLTPERKSRNENTHTLMERPRTGILIACEQSLGFLQTSCLLPFCKLFPPLLPWGCLKMGGNLLPFGSLKPTPSISSRKATLCTP